MGVGNDPPPLPARRPVPRHHLVLRYRPPPWFRHQIIGPGLTTGYAPWPYPGVREAVEKRDTAMFEAERTKVVEAIERSTAQLQRAAAVK